MKIREQTTVFYDGSCPLCRREIAFYRKRAGAESIAWIDVSDAADGEVAPGLSKGEALARFHVRDCKGRLVSGGKAFAKLWGALPRFRYLGKLFEVPPFVWMLDRAYNVFLKLRPQLQTLAVARQSRRRK